MKKRTEPRDEKMLTRQEAEFVGYYIEGGGARGSVAACARKAGFSSGSGLLQRPHIRAEIKKRLGRVMAKKEVTAERVIEEFAKIAFANIDDFVDDEYRIQSRPSRKKMAAVQEVTTETYYEGRGEDAEQVKRVKLKMYSKLDALNSLARHFGLFNDKLEVSGDLGERLDRAFQRLEKEGAEPAGSDE